MTLPTLGRLALVVVALAGCTPAPGDAQGTGDTGGGVVVPEVARARSAMAAGLPWRATLTLQPLLADSTRRTPEVDLLAAEAAAAWGGWAEVRRILGGAQTEPLASNGMAHELLARAALESRDNPGAIAHAREAVRHTPEGAGEDRGRRLVYLARALDRADSLDAAARHYALAAEHLPQVADWLWLRSAIVTHDSLQRERTLAAVSTPVPAARVPRSRAQALERTGDSAAAAVAWRGQDEPGHALAIEAALARTRADSQRVRAGLLEVVRERAGTGEAERAVAALDRSYPGLSAEEELAVARSAARSGPVARASTAYSRAFRGGQGTSADRFRHAGLLERQGNYAQAAQEYARVDRGSSLAPQAAYLRARSILRDGKLEAARTELRAILRDFPRDTASAIALVLLADLAIDEGRDTDARAAYQRVGESFPGSWYGPFGLYQAGIIAWAQGDVAAAVADFDTVATRHPSSDDALGARYWSGRGWDRLGDTARARAAWREVVAAEPASYYGFLAAQRLGVPGWRPAAPAALPAVPDSVRAALGRAALLEQLGMTSEAGLEYAALSTEASAGAEQQLMAGHAMLVAGRPWRAITLGWRAVGRGAPRDATTYALIYPLAHGDALAALSAERGLDPALVAGLIRQESTFNPSATSGAGARGLMQVMPSVGASTARGLGYPLWDPALLWQPDVNLDVGTTHLRAMANQYPDLVRVLAAYNAGGTRVARWNNRAGVEDPELFAERIPYKETRDYVRVVQRNRELYRALYPELRRDAP